MMDRQDRWMDGLDRWMDGLDRWMDGWTDLQMNGEINK